jgi:hypothetical protein
MVSKRWTQSRFSLRADEALDAAVAPGLAHEGGRALDAEEGQLKLVVVGDELAAVVVAQLQAARDALGEGAEAGAHALAERLERLEPRRPAGGVDADTLGRAVIFCQTACNIDPLSASKSDPGVGCPGSA